MFPTEYTGPRKAHGIADPCMVPSDMRDATECSRRSMELFLPYITWDQAVNVVFGSP